jgi:O-antigen/teichoic acid export membrane protein
MILQSTETPPPSLVRNAAWTFWGNLTYAGSQWAMLVVLVKLCSPENVGEFSLGLAISAPLMLFANLQLRTVAATDVSRDFFDGQYLSLRALTAVFAMSAVSVIAFLAYPPHSAAVVCAVALSKSFDSASDILYGFLQRRDRLDVIAKSFVLRGCVSLSLMAAAAIKTHDALWAAAALAAGSLSVLIGYDLPMARRLLPAGSLSPSWSSPSGVRLLETTLPLGFAMLLMSLQHNIPRYFVESRLGLASLAVYSALAYFVVAGNVFYDALAQSAVPRLARHLNCGALPRFHSLMMRLTCLGMIGGIACVLTAFLFGDRILAAFYTERYAAQAPLFVLLMAAAAVSYAACFLNYSLAIARRTRQQAALFALSALVIFLVCSLRVPSAGLRGAAEALLAGETSRLVFTALLYFRWLRVEQARQKEVLLECPA